MKVFWPDVRDGLSRQCGQKATLIIIAGIVVIVVVVIIIISIITTTTTTTIIIIISHVARVDFTSIRECMR